MYIYKYIYVHIYATHTTHVREATQPARPEPRQSGPRAQHSAPYLVFRRNIRPRLQQHAHHVNVFVLDGIVQARLLISLWSRRGQA